jgi:hypothetical protein
MGITAVVVKVLLCKISQETNVCFLQCDVAKCGLYNLPIITLGTLSKCCTGHWVFGPGRLFDSHGCGET